MRLKGYAFPFLSRELCLCQTSTMMLGKECLLYFPVETGWNTDDEIALTIGKHFDVLHSGAYVSIYHMHNSPTKMSSNTKNHCRSVRELVIRRHNDIFRNHGFSYILLWRLRIVRAFVRYHIGQANSRIDSMARGWGRNCWRAYRRFLSYFERTLTRLLREYFVLDYF